MQPINVVAIGGGTGLSTLLNGLKILVPRYIKRLSAVVAVTDNGGSTGRIIEHHEAVPAPGDVRHCITALASTSALKRLLEHRFKQGQELKGHSVGNIILTALTEEYGDFLQAILVLSKILKLRGEVLPALTSQAKLVAKFSDGKVIHGEVEIAEYGRAQRGRILDIWLEARNKKCYAFKAPSLVLKRIRQADLIIVGPGSLYTSLVPNFLIENLRKAFINSTATKIFVMNLMTQYGETHSFTAADHLAVFTELLGSNVFDGVIVNTAVSPADVLEKYKKEGAEPIKIDSTRLSSYVRHIIAGDISTLDEFGRIRHDPKKFASKIKDVIINYFSGR